MLCADPVMDTDQLCLEIGEDEMDDGQELLGHFGIPTFGNGVVIVAALPQVDVTAPMLVDVHQVRRGHIHSRIVVSDNRVQRSGANGERAQALLMKKH